MEAGNRARDALSAFHSKLSALHYGLLLSKMAALFRRCLVLQGKPVCFKHYSRLLKSRSFWNFKYLETLPYCGVLAVTGLAVYLYSRWNKHGNVLFSGPKLFAQELGPDEVKKKARKLTRRELRFLHFASVEYEGQVYMTPQDFL